MTAARHKQLSHTLNLPWVGQSPISHSALQRSNDAPCFVPRQQRHSRSGASASSKLGQSRHWWHGIRISGLGGALAGFRAPTAASSHRATKVAGIDPTHVCLVEDLAEAVECAERHAATALVFRPGGFPESAWEALESTPLPLLAWFHNLGCHQQARTEALPTLRAWVLVSGVQLDAFRHSRLAQSARVIANPVVVPPPSRKVRSWSEAKRAGDLAFMGAITPFKGFHRLAAQWPTIAAACPSSKLLVFGGADLYGNRVRHCQHTAYENHCRELLIASGYAERVRFLGSQGLERYAAMHSVAVGVVNPSGWDETFCLSAAEFNACGIPVVSARRHALVQTILHGQTGLLAGNDRALASACVQLLQNPRLAWQLGRAGQLHVAEAFGPETIRKAWIDLVKDIAANAPIVSPSPSTPLFHEQRWLRQLWGAMLVIPGWPSWPSLKAGLKRLLQGGEHAIGPRGVGLLAGLVALLVWAFVVFGKYGGNPTGLARIGDQMSLSPRLQGQELVVLEGKRGNDGQQFLSLALDPLQLETGTSAAVDNPIYRGKRLLYPLLAYALGAGQPALIVWTLGLINVACIGLSSALVSRWAQLEQRSPQWGLSVLALPAYWITLTLNTADLVATTFMLSAALAWKEQRLTAAWGALSAALMSRETALLAWAATGMSALRERRWRWLPPLALAPLPMVVVTAVLRARYPDVIDGTLATLHFTWPFSGILRKSAQLLNFAPLAGVQLGSTERLFDALSFGLWIYTVTVLLTSSWRGREGRWLQFASGLYLLPALCSSVQILARFPDYTRVWIDLPTLALLVLLTGNSRGFVPWLSLSAILSCGYFVGYILMAP